MQIKTYNSKTNYLNANHFFILSKGNNAGKPLHNPCPNCFVVLVNNVNEKEYYFWLCYCLWVGGMFRPFLTGSVIEFLRISELNHVIKASHSHVQLRRQAFIKAIQILSKLSTLQSNLHKQVQLTKQLQQALIRRLFKSTLSGTIFNR